MPDRSSVVFQEADFLYHSSEEHGKLKATLCTECKNDRKNAINCKNCKGIGFLGVDPKLPCTDYAGSNARVILYAARHRAGLSIFNSSDNPLVSRRGPYNGDPSPVDRRVRIGNFAKDSLSED